MKITSKLLLFVMFITISFISCDQSTSRYSSTENGLNDALNDPAFIDKYNTYVSLGNSVSTEVWTAYGSYIQAVDTVNGTLYNKNYFGVKFRDAEPHQFNKVKELRDKKPAFEELDMLAVLYMDAHKKLRTPLVSLINLQIAGELNKDNYKVLKEKNIEVLQAFENFGIIDASITDVIKEMEKDLNRVELKKLKDEGLHIRYNQLVLMNTLQDHAVYISDFNYENLNTIDQEIHAQKISDLETALTTYSESTNDKAKVKEQITNPTIIGIFSSNVEEYISTSKELAEIAKDESKFKKYVKRWSRDPNMKFGKTPSGVLDRHSRIVDQSNSMI